MGCSVKQAKKLYTHPKRHRKKYALQYRHTYRTSDRSNVTKVKEKKCMHKTLKTNKTTVVLLVIVAIAIAALVFWQIDAMAKAVVKGTAEDGTREVTGNTAFENVTGSLASFGSLIQVSTIIAVSAAFLFFFYHLAMYIWSADDKKEEAKNKMFWGVIAMVVITSLWGLITLARNVFGINAAAGPADPDNSGSTIQVPRVDFNG